MIGASAQTVAGAAGETTKRLEELGVPSLVMADGPAGIRICKMYKIIRWKSKRSGQSAGRNDGIHGSGQASDDGGDGAEADGRGRKSADPLCVLYSNPDRNSAGTELQYRDV